MNGTTRSADLVNLSNKRTRYSIQSVTELYNQVSGGSVVDRLILLIDSKSCRYV